MNLDSAERLSSVLFSRSYLEARSKFLASASGIRSYQSKFLGPAGEELFTDAAYVGRPDARHLLVLVSGTHGVEGYCGSAAQLAFLNAEFQNQLPPTTAVLLVHALNCYGFAWDRRVTAEGCDLNRNFIDFAHPVPVNSGYEDLAHFIVPEEISEIAVSRAEKALSLYQSTHGQQQFENAMFSGQYSRPGGMFYGGREPTEARMTLERIASEYAIGDRDKVVIVDYHTGLGPYGYGELQCEQSSGPQGYMRAREVFGQTVTSPEAGNSSSVEIPGTQDAFWERLLAHRHTYVALEFGTYPRPNGRLLLRKDHWLFKYQPGLIDAPLGRQIRSESKMHFYPPHSDWQEMVLWRCHQVHRQAIAALGR